MSGNTTNQESGITSELPLIQPESEPSHSGWYALSPVFVSRWKDLPSSRRVPGMDQPLLPELFPSGFPSELASAAFVASNEAAWRPALAARSVKWLGTHGFAVLGTELWLPKDGSIQSLPYFQNIDRQGNEAWDSFVARAAAETLAYLGAFTAKFIEEGDVFVNVTWMSEAEFRNLKA